MKHFSWRSSIKKIRLVDIAIGLAAIVAIAFFLFKFSRRPQYVFLDLTFEREGYASNFYPPEYWQVNQIVVGDIVYNVLGNEVATVTAVDHFYWGGGARLYTYVTLRLEALYNTATKTYSHDGNQLIVGKEADFVIHNSNYSGLIRDVYLTPEEKASRQLHKNARLQLFCREYDAWHAEAIKDLRVESSNGEVKARVISMEVTPAATYYPDQFGRVVKGTHPDKKDLDLVVDLYKVECLSNETCFYNQTKTFMIGDELWLDSGETWVGQNCSVKHVEFFDI